MGHDHDHRHDHRHDHGHAHEHAQGHRQAHDHGHAHEHAHASPAALGDGGSAAAAHRARGPASVPCFALTVSDTRTRADDTGGAVIREVLAAEGHTLVGSEIVKDDPGAIEAAIRAALERGARVVIATGGTGLTSRDVTAEVVERLIERPIPGFGELFRMLSFEQVGSAAMLSRATAGVLERSVLFALPGSPAGVRLAMERLIAPELSHLLEQLAR